MVGYPIVEIPEGRRDVHRYVRELEEVMIRVCADYGSAARRIAGKSGTFVGDNKIGAIGVRICWVTSHGFAFNVNTNLSGFDLIVPCGLRDQGVTSLAKLLGAEVNQTEVEDRLISRFLEIMDYPARRGRDQTPSRQQERVDNRQAQADEENDARRAAFEPEDRFFRGGGETSINRAPPAASPGSPR